MSRNIEIKASLKDIKIRRKIAASLSESDPLIIYQEDIFFNVNNGYLKLRLFKNATGELISYNRAVKKGPKTSEYFILKTNTPEDLKKALEHNLGILQKVKKKRELYMFGRTRIHLDEVEQLGEFLELEVVLNEYENPENGEREAKELMKKLHISKDQLIDKAYVELLNEIYK